MVHLTQYKAPTLLNAAISNNGVRPVRVWNFKTVFRFLSSPFLVSILLPHFTVTSHFYLGNKMLRNSPKKLQASFRERYLYYFFPRLIWNLKSQAKFHLYKYRSGQNWPIVLQIRSNYHSLGERVTSDQRGTKIRLLGTGMFYFWVLVCQFVKSDTCTFACTFLCLYTNEKLQKNYGTIVIIHSIGKNNVAYQIKR